MISITLQYPTLAEAHAVLGSLLVQSPAVVVETETPITEDPAVQAAVVADAAAEPKPKKKRAPGRPKGSKDGAAVIRKGTKAANEQLTIEELRDKLQSYANEFGFKAARDALQEFKDGNGKVLKRLPDLPRDQYAKFDQLVSKPPVEAATE